MAIRPYRGADEGALLALWNATLTHDPITPATFRTKVLLDPNFSPDGLLLAEEGGASPAIASSGGSVSDRLGCCRSCAARGSVDCFCFGAWSQRWRTGFIAPGSCGQAKTPRGFTPWPVSGRSVSLR